MKLSRLKLFNILEQIPVLTSCRSLSTSVRMSAQAVVEHQSKWSYVSGPGYPPLLGLTIGQAVDRAEDMFGDREALVVSHQNIRRTFSEVKQEVDSLAAGLIELGLVPGDRIGIRFQTAQVSSVQCECSTVLYWCKWMSCLLCPL